MQLHEPPHVRLVLVQQMRHLQGIHTYGKKRHDSDCQIREGDLGLDAQEGRHYSPRLLFTILFTVL